MRPLYQTNPRLYLKRKLAERLPGLDADLLLKAYGVFNEQKSRCYNPSNRKFGTYGAKGVKVGYTFNEFARWFCVNYPRDGKRWDVGRVRHDRSYTFKNILFQDAIENIQERNSRCGNPCVRKAVIATLRGKKMEFASKKEAAEFFKVNAKTVYNHCENKTKPSDGVRFKWK